MGVDADNIPMHWFCQLQYQLHVAGYREGALAWLVSGREFGYKNIMHDEEFCEYLTDQIREFWERYIIGNEEPPAYNVDDVVVKYARHTDGKFIKANADVVAAAVRLKEVKQQIAELTQQKESAEATIKMAIGDAEGVQGDDGKVIATWKAGKDKAVFDTKRFAADHPEEYAEYITQKAAARTFLLK
jgi:predicted phage-related endonuclease